MAIRITRAGVALTVGIIVVTGLIIGGLFLVKNQGEQARRDEAIKIAEQKLEDQSGNGVALNDGEDNAETNQSEETSQGAGGEVTSGEANSGDVAGQATANELPATGPVDTAATILIASILTFSVVSYFQSRRALLEKM